MTQLHSPSPHYNNYISQVELKPIDVALQITKMKSIHWIVSIDVMRLVIFSHNDYEYIFIIITKLYKNYGKTKFRQHFCSTTCISII